jgi:hydrogenase maturation protein HypF
VGFRPFVHSLAAELQLSGFVRNQSGSVQIEVEGDSAALDIFRQKLTHQPPPLARIDRVTSEAIECRGQSGFDIEASTVDRSHDVFISPDVATCDDCLAEMRDPHDRRYGYPFINCTNCGPRLTIIRAAPYDRAQTTMASFVMCPQCLAEYNDPANRRFHAEPMCCPQCGPRLRLLSGAGDELSHDDPLVGFVGTILHGGIGALKGLGGYHLVCDASRAEAVEELRRRKHRDDKPFAVMVTDLEQAARLCHVNGRERALLSSPRRPIVLLRRRTDNRGEAHAPLAAAIAPNNPHLGLILPYTPLHHLLVVGAGRTPLVMTSGNRSDEPIAYDDESAPEQLEGIADVFLTHDRPIHVRCDDSVTRVIDGSECVVRRSRGYAPVPIPLSTESAQPILAVGGQLKGTFALARGPAAFVSHHLGDLDHYEAYRAFLRDVPLYEDLFEVRPTCIAHDFHPDYAATRYAQERARTEGLTTLAVQHHHAHIASCMAEHGLTGEVIGVAFDGTGLGTDGAIWGGEFLVANYRGFERAAFLRYVPLPGGDAAIREPWRMSAAYLLDAGCDLSLLDASVDLYTTKTVLRMCRRGIHAPPTSSMGRLFDGVAAMIGVRSHTSFEGQAAMELEWLATDVPAEGSYPFKIVAGSPNAPSPAAPREPYQIAVHPLIRGVVADLTRGVDQARIARRFHSTIVEMVVQICGRLREQTGLNRIVLSGGVFMNAILITETPARLRAEGFDAFCHHQVPTNDGGISLGQLAVASAVLGDGAGNCRANAPGLFQSPAITTYAA